MKLIGLAGILALSSLACQRKEEAAVAKPAAPAPVESASSPAPAPAPGEKKETPASKPTKAGERPEVTQKKPPVAEPVADKPGFVKSPFSGTVIDVRGIPAGRLVADPMFPAEEKKYFRIPEMTPENDAIAREEMARRELVEETAKLNAPVAKFVPDNPRFIVSPYDKPGPDVGPYDRMTIDVSGLEPGSLILDPRSTPDEPRYIKIPGGEAPTEGK